jgi:hypothetical protein
MFLALLQLTLERGKWPLPFGSRFPLQILYNCARIFCPVLLRRWLFLLYNEREQCFRALLFNTEPSQLSPAFPDPLRPAGTTVDST